MATQCISDIQLHVCPIIHVVVLSCLDLLQTSNVIDCADDFAPFSVNLTLNSEYPSQNVTYYALHDMESGEGDEDFFISVYSGQPSVPTARFIISDASNYTFPFSFCDT